MPLPCSQVVHIRLEVFDDSTLVSGGQICTRVRELEGSNSGVMGLQDCLKIERQAIPEGKLSACRPS